MLGAPEATSDPRARRPDGRRLRSPPRVTSSRRPVQRPSLRKHLAMQQAE